MRNHRHTVLFIDDELNILRALKRLLRAEQMTVLCTSRPREALELLERHPVQVVVSDQQMPEMCGTDLLSRVRDLHPGLVRMMLTGCMETPAVLDAVIRGEIHRVVPKPWDGAELRSAIREAFEHADLLESGPRRWTG